MVNGMMNYPDWAAGLGCTDLHVAWSMPNWMSKSTQHDKIQPREIMNIYFSCSITGGREDQKIYQTIVDHLLEHGHIVPTAHLSSNNILSEEAVIEPVEVYHRDVQWVTDCDALIAEVSTPSHGVGYEIALALSLNKPVLCCHKRDRKISKMLSGNTHPDFKLVIYSNADDLLEQVDIFLNGRN